MWCFAIRISVTAGYRLRHFPYYKWPTEVFLNKFMCVVFYLGGQLPHVDHELPGPERLKGALIGNTRFHPCSDGKLGYLVAG